MTKNKLLNKITAYQYAIRTNNTEWTNSILTLLESENYHQIVKLLLDKQFDEAKQLTINTFK